MKLSMWMLANRLSSLLDLETEISLDAKPVLNSARLVYSTNCVHLYEEKGKVVCDGEGDIIRIRGLSLKEAFEIVQGVFDYFQDWESQVQESIRNRDFQTALDQCDVLFQNPLALINANYAVLARSSSFGPEDVDEEWKYLCTYGCSSPKAVREMKQDPLDNTERFGYQSYQSVSAPGMNYGGFTYHLQFNQIGCGRLTLLAITRELNPGDYQLMVKLAEYLEPALSIYSDNRQPDTNAFYNLLLHRSYSDQGLTQQMNYLNWTRKDSFQLAILKGSEGSSRTELQLLLFTLQKLLPDILVFVKDTELLLLANRELSNDQKLLDYFRQILVRDNYRIGFSLLLTSTSQIPSLYSQAAHALFYAQNYLPEENICHFQTSAVYYILDTQYPADRIHACHPVVRKLWRDKKNKQDDLYDTLKEYLDQERSLVRTAEKLFTHRNTVLYRIKKATALLNDDLEDSAHRYYIRLSMQCLEMIETAGHSSEM